MTQIIKKYSIIDIETTGGSARANKIIEIALINIDGNEIVESFSSLVHPERSIPPQIQFLTGITDEMVEAAPRFFELAKKIVELTEDRIFVAHNAHFDYSFIQNEFRELGYQFKKDLLCTVRLSRKILPGHPTYSLGRLCERLQIPLKNRHRAMGDAHATALLFQMIQDKKSQEFETVFNSLNVRINFPPHFEESDYENLPKTPGVYYLWDKDSKLLYIGKAKDIKKRVRQHFMVKSARTKEYAFKNNIAGISFQETGNELAALLLEAHEIKVKAPFFNRALRRKSFPWTVIPYQNSSGVLEFRKAKVNDPAYPIRCGSSRKAESTINKIYRLAFALEPSIEAPLEQSLALLQKTLGVEKYNQELQKRYEALTYAEPQFQLKLKGRGKKEHCLIKRFHNEQVHLVYIKDGEETERFVLSDNPDLCSILIQYMRKHELKSRPLSEDGVCFD